MKVSFGWLKDYVAIDAAADVVADKLIHTGFNLEEIVSVGSDTMLDLEVTSNRPDCLGHLGVAREVAAIFGGDVKLPDLSSALEVKSDAPNIGDLASVQVIDGELCPRYLARVITNVKVGPSPDWLVKRLETLGLRSVNNIVDITNYVLMETGQPLHAFDLDKLAEKKIIVRPAKAEEPFTAIDHSEHKLESSMLVIADGEKPSAIAGIMGGLDSEVTESTKNILLESAVFAPLSIRRTARKLNLHSDSSFRFERKVDQVGVDWASQRAAAMIVELAGGTLARGMIDLWAGEPKINKVELKFEKMSAVLGFVVPTQQIVHILNALGFQIESQDADKVIVITPSSRADITRPIDLIEEIGRIVGFDNVPIRDTIQLRAVPPSKTKQLNRLVHQALNECGFNEAITVTLVESKVANLFTNVPNDNILRVVGDRRLATDAIRCSLLPSLLAARRLNQDAGNEVSNLYEIAHVFLPGEANALPLEHQSLAILNSQADLLAIRGVLELIAKRANSSEKIYLLPKAMEWFLPDQSAAIMLGDKQIGIIGTITPAIQKQFELRKPVAVAQLNYDLLKDLPLDPIPVMLLPKFPAIVRDLSIIVDERLQWAQIEAAIEALKLANLEAVEFGELFRGKQIPKGQKSLFFSLRYRNSDRSLTHEEVDQEQKRVIDAMTDLFKAQLRAS